MNSNKLPPNFHITIQTDMALQAIQKVKTGDGLI